MEETKRKVLNESNNTLLNLSIEFNQELEKRISYKTKISNICDALNTNRKKVSYAVKSTTNRTPKQVLDERILLELKRLLVYTNLTIKEIADKLEFDETSNLTNYFKRNTGITPSLFREKHLR